jgi:hypothetical protein
MPRNDALLYVQTVIARSKERTTWQSLTKEQLTQGFLPMVEMTYYLHV